MNILYGNAILECKKVRKNNMDLVDCSVVYYDPPHTPSIMIHHVAVAMDLITSEMIHCTFGYISPSINLVLHFCKVKEKNTVRIIIIIMNYCSVISLYTEFVLDLTRFSI